MLQSHIDRVTEKSERILKRMEKLKEAMENGQNVNTDGILEAVKNLSYEIKKARDLDRNTQSDIIFVRVMLANEEINKLNVLLGKIGY